MSYGYTKLFGATLLQSSVWQEDLHVKVVWVTMLSLVNAHGVVSASVPGLARTAGVTIKQCEEALQKFLSPDKYSRTKDFEGRRITEVDGGWLLLNHEKYRNELDAEEQRAKAAERMRRIRAERRAAREQTNAGERTRTEANDPEPPRTCSPPRESTGFQPNESEHVADVRDHRSQKTDTDPESRPPRACARAIPPSTEYDPDSASDRGRLAERTYTRLSDLRLTIAAELGIAGAIPFPPITPATRPQGYRDALDRVREEGAAAPAVCERVLEALAEQARDERDLEWLSEKAFSIGGWRTAREAIPGRRRPPRRNGGKPESGLAVALRLARGEP